MEGFDDLRRLMAEVEALAGDGQVLITAHLGAWELLAQSTVRAAASPVCAVAKPARSAAMPRSLSSECGRGRVWG